MERKRKLEVYEAAPAGAAPPSAAANGSGIGFSQQTAAPPSGDVNPYNGRTYSTRYHQILAGRQGEHACGLRRASGGGTLALLAPTNTSSTACGRL